ncbi:MAG: type VI secretion system ATPase TssH, partial [Deltaproteobacteria bacterium]
VEEGEEAEKKDEQVEHETEESIEEVRKQYDEAVEALKSIQGKDPLIHHEVTTDIVAKVVSDWTGIPVGKMLRDEAASILQLEDNLKARIKGQDHAISTICQIIRSAKAGLTSPNAPLGVFLLVGPSGVGKTETGLSVADLLFGGERFMVTINMSEFQEKHTVSRLIGSPPGYVGYGEGGVLTEAVRQRPYSVVLLDEVEKADPEVMNLFYQVFDKGMLSDGEGRVINFSNTVLFLTSNLASDVITEMASGEDGVDLEVLMSAIRPILSNHFKPALLARMTVVPYLPLNPEAMKEIVSLKLDKLGDRLMESHKISFKYSPVVVEQIAARCTEVETGARNIDHIMQGTLLPKISNEILAKMGEGKLPSRLNLDIAEDGQFSIEFSD